MKPLLHSRIAKGWVRHRRHTPKENAFRYRVFMMYIDLDELPDLLSRSLLWGNKWYSLARYKRSDFWGDDSVSLKDAILDEVVSQIGCRPTGSVRMLTNLRYFGYITNPLTTYYCYDADETLKAIVANVNNTPWGESHAYVLRVEGKASLPKGKYECEFEKNFHVSPFNPIAMQYRWVSHNPSSKLFVHLENWCEQKKIMDATLSLSAEPISSKRLALALIQYPFMTVKVISLIYWQALKLWFKKVPFFSHPIAE